MQRQPQCFFLLILLASITGSVIAAGSTPSPNKSPPPMNAPPFQYNSPLQDSWIPTDTIWSDVVQPMLDANNFTGALTALLAVENKTADVYNLLGYSYRSLTPPDYTSSESSYMQALSIQSDHCGAREYLGELYLAKEELSKAKEQLTQIKELCPEGQEGSMLETAIAAYESNIGEQNVENKACFLNFYPMSIICTFYGIWSFIA
eukprot:CAMPEP_0196584300 /NCGR_PEP_ID=MMETSP1081-20130531/46573_1 /TAXON_ID=36882 /ORGANISM="Pyramimonas amylifera, Strain CCMP720" /LENGTH=204 /DNA_ID=CAMNT_0041905457 /DNA_START=146 /DNA_END=760 /DNA_ORIENTATION=+